MVGVLLMQNKIIDLTHARIGNHKKQADKRSHAKKKRKSKSASVHIKVKDPICYIDLNHKLSSDELKQREEYNQARYQVFLNSIESHVDHSIQANVVQMFLDSIEEDKHYMLATWTYPKRFGQEYEEALKDIFGIRSRIIKLLFQNFRPRLNNRRSDCPRMYFFAERHSDGQYHIHLIMEAIEPDLWATCLERKSFRLRWNTIINKINGRNPIQKMVISQKMIDRWSDYKNHPYANKTFDQIKSDYDEWKVARFICDYISHYTDNERWGLNRISNSPENNHSKVIESKAEIHSKCSYLNKDRYFIDKDNDFLRHIVPEYSDF